MLSFATATKSSLDDAPQIISSAAARGLETSLTFTPRPGEGLEELFGRLADALPDTTIVQMLVFGSVNATAAGTEAMRRRFGNVDWPVTWVEGGACDDNPIAGIQIFGLVGGEVERLRLGGRVVGSVFDDGSARHCWLGGLGPVENSSSRAEQTRQTLEQLEQTLGLAGFSLADVVRTWFFLEDILSWYDDFNRARNEIYSGVKFRTGSLPASTGIGAKNPAGTALAVAVWAMQPHNGRAHAREIASPLQCPAPAYGSSFSRAMEISSPAGRRLLVSGTASITPLGRTAHVGDVARQIDLSMEAVAAILRSRGYTFSDLTRATAYFKHRADVRAFTDWCAAHGWRSLPVVAAHCDICRSDLLFELEADAAQPG